MFYAWDMNYILWVLLPGIVIGAWAQIRLRSAYGKYSKIPVESGMTGAEAARRILDNTGLVNTGVEEIPGQLSDHFDPQKHTLFLSSDVYNGRTVAAVGVAAHEAGHALQQHAGYGLFNLRMTLVPVTQFASHAWMGIIVLGMIMHLPHVIMLAVAVFAVITLFQLVTLPVEYDASARAKEQLFRLGLVRETERAGISTMLHAAALTYVAALVNSVLQLLYYISLARGSRN